MLQKTKTITFYCCFKKIIQVVLLLLISTASLTSSASVLSHTKKVSPKSVAEEDNQKTWTFDCSQQGWGVREHNMSMTASHVLSSSSLNSGHIEMTTPAELTQGWMFGPADAINTDKYKYCHFSLTVDNADQLPENGLDALFVFADNADQNLATKSFKIFKGQKNYTIDLTGHSEWKGTKYINRIHFPHTSGEGYNIENAIYRLDWIAVSDLPNSVEPVQDTTAACISITPEIGEVESVVFCNRVSFKTTLSGSRADAILKMWMNQGDTITQTLTINEPGVVYLSAYDLALNTTYNYTIEMHNSAGSEQSEVMQFTTKAELAEEQPVNFWMTPGPFDLTENASDHLLDNDSWKEAAELAQVFKIHGAAYPGNNHPGTYDYDLPKLIYTLNKYRMRLALETIVGGNRTGAKYAEDILGYIEELAEYGGKLEFLTQDGIFLHCYNLHQTQQNFRTPDEGIEAIADAVKIVKDSYPDFQIIPLPNLPNWDVRDADGNTVPHNAGNKSHPDIANATWMELCDSFLEKMAERGIANPINHIEIDHPYYYYYKDGDRETSRQRIQAMKDYCTDNNLELIVIVNQSEVGNGDDASKDAAFKKGCLDFVDVMREDGINPAYIDVESWYPFPQYLIPETKENSFTNVIRDVGNKFFFEGKMEIRTEGDVTEIIGSDNTLQLVAKHIESGDTIDVNWTFDNPGIASVDSTGILTSHNWGEVNVTATAKDGSGLFASLKIKVTDPDEPTAITIKSEGDVTEIVGKGTTLQFYAENADNGNSAEVHWSVDNIRAASIDSTGLLTSVRLGTVNIKATLQSNPDVSATFQLAITDNPTGIKSYTDLEQIKVFPNPADRHLYIEIPHDINDVSVKLLDIKGKNRWLKTNLQAGKYTLETKRLPNGMYFLQIISDDDKIVHKVLVNR
jgi:hypothetical protein